MRAILLLAIAVFAVVPSSVHAQGGWKAGVARTKITPQENMWMAGYGFRTKPSEGTDQELWGKALALEDAAGNKSLFVSTDILGFSKEVSDRVRKHLHSKFGLTKAQIILSSSHTHSGPVLSNALIDIYPLTPADDLKVARYTSFFEKEVIRISEEALRSLKPVKVESGSGVTRFGVNRRTNQEAKITELFELKGPSDFSVPVLKILNADNTVGAIVFGYACHSTVLNEYKFSGDYPGFAQEELEKLYPGATALFFLGAAGDQNPLPRRGVAKARQYGKDLANAVQRVIEEPMRVLSPKLSTAYAEIDLEFMPAPTKEELTKMIAEKGGYEKKWAERMLQKSSKGEKNITSYPYPVQLWMIGDQPLFSLGGEVTIEYAVQLKQMFGNEVFVAAYTNDVMGYIPSQKVLREGGYEGETSQKVYGLPAKWKPSIESDILNKALELGSKVGLSRK
jgi:neutral ceramidase